MVPAGVFPIDQRRAASTYSPEAHSAGNDLRLTLRQRPVHCAPWSSWRSRSAANRTSGCNCEMHSTLPSLCTTEEVKRNLLSCVGIQQSGTSLEAMSGQIGLESRVALRGEHNAIGVRSNGTGFDDAPGEVLQYSVADIDQNIVATKPAVAVTALGDTLKNVVTVFVPRIQLRLELLLLRFLTSSACAV